MVTLKHTECPGTLEFVTRYRDMVHRVGTLVSLRVGGLLSIEVPTVTIINLYTAWYIHIIIYLS